LRSVVCARWTRRWRTRTASASGLTASTACISRTCCNAYNNIAVVGDAYVVACPYLVDLEATLAVFASNGATLAAIRAVDTLLTAVGEELVSATIIDGGGLSVANMPDLGLLGASTPVPVGTIAPAAYALLGITPGSMPSRYTDEDNQLQGDNGDTAPRSIFIVALHLGSVEEAGAAAPVIEGRLAEGVSLVSGLTYAEVLGTATVAAVTGSSVVTRSGSPATGSAGSGSRPSSAATWSSSTPSRPPHGRHDYSTGTSV